MKRFLLVIAINLIGILAMHAQSVASADAVMSSATAKAAKENKKVFIIFHASWCGWCHKMDTSMNDVSVKKYFTDNYVIEHLTVLESDKNKSLENPGAMEMLTTYKGDQGGIPFWLIFDQDGKLLADSKIKKDGDPLGAGDNSGCPANEKEVDYLIQVLKKTSKMNDADEMAVRKVFRRNE